MTAASTRNQFARAALAQVVIVDRTTPDEPGAVAKSYAIADAVIAALGASTFTRDNMAAAAVLALTDFQRSGNTWDDATIASAAVSLADLMVASSTGPDIPPAGGGAIVGTDPNAIVFMDPTGTNGDTDPKLTAFPIDPFARPQIRDWRSAAGIGPVWRQGAWQADGDASNQKAEGFVSYGANALGLGPTGTDGGYARIKPNRIGLAQILPGVNAGALYYPIRLDSDPLGGIDGMQLKDDESAALTFAIARSTGTVVMGSPTSPLAAPGSARFFGNQSGTLHGSNAGMQYSSLVANRAQLRCNAYGAHVGVPGITGFKSRGLTIGALAAVAPGDVLWRATAIGVCADNASIPLSGLLSFVATTVAAARIGCDLQVQQSPSTGPQRITWTFDGETGDLLGAVNGAIVRETLGGQSIGLGPKIVTWLPGGAPIPPATLPPNTVTTWAGVMALLTATTGQLTVALDTSLGPCVTPAGAFDLEGRVMFVPAAPDGTGSPIVLTIGPGSQLLNPAGFRGKLRINAEGDVAPAAMEFNLGGAGGASDLLFDQGVEINANTIVGFPLMFVPGPYTLNIRMDDAALLPFGVFCDVLAGGNLLIQAANWTTFPNDMVTVAAGGTITWTNDASVQFPTSMSGDLSGTYFPNATLRAPGILKGTNALVVLGQTALIPARGLRATSVITAFLRDDPAGSGAATTRYGALQADRVYGIAGSFKITALAGVGPNIADSSILDWTVYT